MVRKPLNPIIIVIALTANAPSDEWILCEEAGMDQVVTEPFKRADLSKVLMEYLPKLVVK